jgi:hypothetical protein
VILIVDRRIYNLFHFCAAALVQKEDNDSSSDDPLPLGAEIPTVRHVNHLNQVVIVYNSSRFASIYFALNKIW